MNRKTLLATAIASTLVFSSAQAAGDRLSDTWKEASIHTAYTLNAHLNPFDIEVEVTGAKALLTGSVESEVERALAEEIALGTDGVESVDNRLVVENTPPNALERTGRDFAQVVDDATLAARVKSQLLWNQQTSGLDINVSTDHRVVSLTGTVGSEAERDLVRTIARNTDGVLGVESDLEVVAKDSITENAAEAAKQAGQAVSDSWVTAKVKSSLMFNRNVDSADILVETHDGVVTLSGTVDSEHERVSAVSIASGVVGVKAVHTAFETSAGTSS